MAHGGGDMDFSGPKPADKQPAARGMDTTKPADDKPATRGRDSTDLVSRESEFLATDFIHFRLEQDGVHADYMEAKDDQFSVDQQEKLNEVALALRTIGDELDNDIQLQRLIKSIPVECPKETFFGVAAEIFSDGKFSWGRVVALFYFGYKLARRAAETMVQQMPLLVRTVINWIVLYIREYVAQWILDRGGWGGVMEWFGTPKQQFAGIVLAGALGSAFVFLRKFWS